MLRNHLKVALRTLRRHPALSSTSIVGLVEHVFSGSAASEAEAIKNELLRSPDIRNVAIASEWPTRESNGQLPFRIEGMLSGEGIQMAWLRAALADPIQSLRYE